MREPRTVYIYIAKEFFKAFAASIAAITIIMLANEFFEAIHEMLNYHASVLSIFNYFAYRSALTALKISPIATLLGVLFTLNSMTKNNEITAMKTSGMNLARIAAPILLSSLLISAAVIIVHESFAADLYYKSKLLKHNQILKTGFDDRVSSADDVAFSSGDGITAYARHFDSDKGILENVFLLYRKANGTVFRRIDSPLGRWNGKEWQFFDCIIRDFTGPRLEETLRKAAILSISLHERPEDLVKSKKLFEEFTLSEMRNYIDNLKKSGGKFKQEEMNYQFKISLAFANVILALIGIPFGLGAGKYSGIIFSFVVSLVFALIYNNLLFIGQSLGSNNLLNPFLAAWFGNIIFLLFGAGMLYKARK